jgi:hypothetical protein
MTKAEILEVLSHVKTVAEQETFRGYQICGEGALHGMIGYTQRRAAMGDKDAVALHEFARALLREIDPRGHENGR